MKKQAKQKKASKSSSKSSSKRSAVQGPGMPDLVTGMMKLVERLEAVERKMDQVLSRVSNLPSDMRNAVQQYSRPGAALQMPLPQRPEQQAGRTDGRNDRVMYQAVCADCCKNCEVPFKPSSRPVYCKECFAIRKAGHAPQDPDRRSVLELAKRKLGDIPGPSIVTIPERMATAVKSTAKRGKKKPAHKSGKRR